MVAAKASAESIKFITEAVKENNSSAMFLLGDSYITALQNMSASENSKIIVMPGDLVGEVKSLVGGK
jgi:regulator of protease activity HflC (stomatin/prohibitin superfamily)